MSDLFLETNKLGKTVKKLKTGKYSVYVDGEYYRDIDINLQTEYFYYFAVMTTANIISFGFSQNEDMKDTNFYLITKMRKN